VRCVAPGHTGWVLDALELVAHGRGQVVYAGGDGVGPEPGHRGTRRHGSFRICSAY